MNNSTPSKVETTLGELIAALCEETEICLRGAEKNIVVAYILNDLLRNPDFRNHHAGTAPCRRGRIRGKGIR
jgi:hypothetical protein